MSESTTARLSDLLQGGELIDRLGESIPGLLYVYDLLERRNVYSNRSMAALLGYSSPEEVAALGENLLVAIIHPDDLPRTLSHHESMASYADDRVLEIEYRVRGSDGDYRWLHSWETVVSREASGQPRYLLGIAQDVTARVTMEQELLESRKKLSESEQRWRSIAENPFDFVVVIDRDYRYTYVNFVAPGLKQEELLGKKTPFDFVEPAHHATMREAFEQTFQQGRPSFYEVYVPPLDQWYSTLVGPIREGGGEQVTHISLLTRDITEQKRSLEQARRADEQLRALESKLAQTAKLEAVGRLAGGIAHDFNNLLTGIGGVAELMARRLSPDDDMLSDVNELSKAVERGAGLTRQLLAFSREQPVMPTSVELTELVREVGPMVHRLIGESIELTFHGSSEPIHVRCDRSQLEQVLLNLAVNARDAMPRGGSLTIELSKAQLAREALQEHPEVTPGNFARLSVTDTGAGIEPAVLPHIFEPFYTTKPVGSGTGLGLFMVYGIVRRGGGFIEVASRPGQGTTFGVYLPVVSPAPSERPAPLPAPRGGHERLLLVEDDDLVRRLTRTLLASLGYEVHVAERGDTALSMLEAGLTVDLLVSDALLPGLSGGELYSKALELRPDLPVVFISGYTDGTLSGAELGPRTTFLAKPFTREQLAEKVRSMLDGLPRPS